MRYRCRKGDVRAAFLQGTRVADEQEESVFADSVPQLAKALGLRPGDVVRLRKAVYGLTTAPRKWWKKVCADMKRLGWQVE